MPSLAMRSLPLLLASVVAGCSLEKGNPLPEGVPYAPVIEVPEADDVVPAGIAGTSISPAHVAPKRAPYRRIPAPRDVAAPARDAVRAKSGLAMKVLVAGRGQSRPKVEDRV